MWPFSLLLCWGCCGIYSWKMHVVSTVATTTGVKTEPVNGSETTSTSADGSLDNFSGDFQNVNECADTTACPAYATCNNTMESYYCTCKNGFLSSNGQSHFKGPGIKCTDIDECSQSSPKCGPNSVCRNMLGRYKCSCFLGFSSPTGNDWTPEKPGSFACTDVDECLSSGVCPEHSDCVNSMGSYSCSCQVGFISSNSTCEDINECVVKMCPANATCTNTPGSYFCNCRPGFAPSSGQLDFTDQAVECRDIDECFQDPSPCGPNSVCTNTLGSYSCSCSVGFHPNSEGFQKYGNFSCKRIPFKCKEDVISSHEQIQQCPEGAAVKSEYGSFCGLINDTFHILDNVCENKTAVVPLKSVAKSLSSVLEQISTWSRFTKEETSTLGTVLLESVESTTLAALLNPSANFSETIQTEFLDIESKVINDECTEENIVLNLKAKGDEMKIGCSTIAESGSTGECAGTTGVAFVSFVGMESALDEHFFQDLQTSLGNSQRKLKMNSRVIGGMMTGERKDDFSAPIIYTLENIQMVFSLYVISHVGMIISLVCLIVAIATFLLCRSIQNRNTDIHLHLCVCLFLAKSLFLAGIDKTDNKMGCAIIAGFLHYLFLACFFWMLVEAVMLFLMVRNLKVVNYFSSRNIKMLHLCAFGYGLPGLVVLISATVQPWGYGMYNR
ncbi:adhesion G protein-coupled receptor E1 [Otolemur garnettii]|uniref:adhesion G protein-coupled receptor E1 n=1 Tax=Otolemur garnettii TaxID=30611 RepID=UPI000C7EB319|nr:adhesion G protein-coupled receptor E1 [Otolemur garnettii]